MLARAQTRREAESADYVQSEHVRAAIEELGLDVEEREIRDAPSCRER